MSTLSAGRVESRPQHPSSAHTLDSLADDLDQRGRISDACASKRQLHGSAPDADTTKPGGEAEHAQTPQGGRRLLTIKQKVLSGKVPGSSAGVESSDDAPSPISSLAAYLRARVFAHGGELVLAVGGAPSQGESSTSSTGEADAPSADSEFDADPEAPDDGSLQHVTPDEYTRILANLKQAGPLAGCAVNVLLEKGSTAEADGEKALQQAWIMLRQIPEAAHDFVEIRVACVGNVDAGKSTTLGVLTKGGLDDGRGKARV